MNTKTVTYQTNVGYEVNIHATSIDYEYTGDGIEFNTHQKHEENKLQRHGDEHKEDDQSAVDVEKDERVDGENADQGNLETRKRK